MVSFDGGNFHASRLSTLMLMVGLASTLMPEGRAALQFNGVNSKATLDGVYFKHAPVELTFIDWFQPLDMR